MKRNSIIRQKFILGLSFIGLTFNIYSQNLDLLDIYQIAEKNDPLIKQEAENYRAIQEDENISVSQLLPQLNLKARVGHASVGHITTPRKFYYKGYDLKLDQVIFDWAKWSTYLRSEPLITAAEKRWYLANQNLIIRVAESYLNILKAMDAVEFTEKQYKATNELLLSAKERYKVGTIIRADLEQVQSNLDKVNADLIKAKNDVENSREILQQILNKPVPPIAKLNDKFKFINIAPRTINEWRDVGHKYSLEIQEANANRLVAKRNINISEGGYLPTVMLHSKLRGSNSRGIPAQDAGVRNRIFLNTWSINLEITSPNLNPYGAIAKNNQAIAQYHGADQKYTEVYRATDKLIQQYYRDAKSFSNQVTALGQAVVASESALNATKEGFKIGTKTYTHLLDRIRDLYKVKIDYRTASYDYLLSILQLENAAGRLDILKLAEINESFKQDKRVLRAATVPMNTTVNNDNNNLKKLAFNNSTKIELPSPTTLILDLPEPLV